MSTFYWYDHETTGLSFAVDCIVQFAGQCTDEALRPTACPRWNASAARCWMRP